MLIKACSFRMEGLVNQIPRQNITSAYGSTESRPTKLEREDDSMVGRDSVEPLASKLINDALVRPVFRVGD